MKVSYDNNDSVKISNELVDEVSKINLQKKVVSKYVEIKKTIIYTFRDGSKKEVVETENHTFTD